ncbi:Hypothetical protein HVR_LOCUS827 [uncultured virus]|nr:Hypothetical protein HVR_LOCUS827 [uncultured virus]
MDESHSTTVLSQEIELFLKSNKIREFLPLKDDRDPTPELNYLNLFFKFHKIKDRYDQRSCYGKNLAEVPTQACDPTLLDPSQDVKTSQSYELIVSKTKFIMEIEELKSHVDEFMAGDKTSDSIDIHNFLRRPIREFKTLYPELHYFAKGTQKFYQLILSKNMFDISFNELDNKTRTMFIEYSGLKINPTIHKDAYALLNPYLGLDAKFKELSEVLWDLGGEKDFINKHYAIVNAVIDTLNRSPKYQDWIDFTPITHTINPKVTTTNINVYQPCNATELHSRRSLRDHGQNHNSYFISIDLKSANYQVLHLQGLIPGSWDEFLSQFTPYDYHRRSKFLRLKCLSHQSLLPNKQQKVWKNLIIEVLNAMITDNIISGDNIAAHNNDEIIIKANSRDMETQLQKYRKYLSREFPHLNLSVELFQLKKIGKHYAKVNPLTGKVNFKCVNAKQMPGLIAAFNKLKE